MKWLNTVTSLALMSTLAGPAKAWEVHQETSDTGAVLTIAEQIGEGGALLQIVCFEKESQIEVIAPAKLEPGDAAILFQVDGKPEVLIAGFWKPVDRRTTLFIGVDRRDRPAAQTKNLIRQIKAGRALYIGDPDVGEGIERFNLSGSGKALAALEKNCR